MRRRFVASLLALTVTLSAQSPAARPILGFGDPGREHALEAQFDAKLNRDNLRAWMERMTARPHHVGSPQGKANAEFMASLFRSWGYDTAIERFDVLFPTPKSRIVELVAPETFTAQLQEPPLREDKTSSQVDEILPVFNAYSIDGDVTGDLVYVNYGIPADYEVLERNGIDVRGKIVIARYGGSWRGIKPKVAAEKGAIGCIIYSDPLDDGYAQGDVYPTGAYRSEYSAQRGSVADMPLFPGDPLTPGAGAVEGAKRLDRKDAPTLTKIPVLPIAYADALPLLKALRGPVAPEEWRGALPITYHLGPGPARVHLKLEFDWKLVPAYDVIAKLRGSDLPDQWILRGNHHDAWVHGARDPVSGMVSLMEEARAIGELARSGWRPRRTLVFAAWDAEEQGLLGSTEWVETHLAELKEKAVIYINSDSNGRGFLDAGGSHTLARFVTEVARDVEDPQRKVSVLERLTAYELTRTPSAETRKEIRDRSVLKLDALGSGSDYTPFLQHAGIASLSIGYGGEPSTASTTRHTTRSITSSASAIRTSTTASPRRRRPAGCCCASRMPTFCRSRRRRSRRPSPTTRCRCRSSPTRCAARRKRRTGSSASGRWSSPPIRPSRSWRRRRRSRCRISSSPRWRMPSRDCRRRPRTSTPLQNATTRRSCTSSARSPATRACPAVPGTSTTSTRPVSTPATA
jgi:N-acetylated-alpha-linked acidic dipeptidase